jgi:hypothetical protein
MKPWEHENTINKLKKMSGEETVNIGISLTETALEILISSIYTHMPDIGEEELWKEVKKVIWEVDMEASKIVSTILPEHLKR